MSDIKLLLLLRSAVLAKHPRGWIVGVTDLPLKDFVEACNESELLTAEIEDGDGLCVIRYIIPDEKRPGIIIIKKQDEAKLNTPVPFSETKIQRLERERDEARRELNDTLKEWDIAREGWNKALEERDEARRELAEALKEWEVVRNDVLEERNKAMRALEWIAGRYCHEKTTVQLAQEAYEMFSTARWTLQELEQKEEAK